MPDDYIIYREKYKNNGAMEWRELYEALSLKQKSACVPCAGKKEFHNIVRTNKAELSSRRFNPVCRQARNGVYSKYKKVNNLLSHYKKCKSNDLDHILNR